MVRPGNRRPERRPAMQRIYTWIALVSVPVLLSACAEGRAEPGAVELVYDNALNANGLEAVALPSGALGVAALRDAALGTAGAGLGDPGPAGERARQLLRYAIGCAL